MHRLPSDGAPRALGARVLVWLAAAASLLLAVGTWIVLRDPALSFSSPVALLARNVAPVLLAAVSIWALFRRLTIAIAFGIGAFWLLHLLNSIKLQNMDMPLLPTDATAIGQVVSNPGLFLPYLPRRLIGVVGLACLALCALSLRHEPSTFPRAAWVRVTAGATCALLALVAFTGDWPMRHVYAGQFDDGDAVQWNPRAFYEDAGLVNGFAFLAAQARKSVGAHDKAMIEGFRDRHRDALATRSVATHAGRMPDIFIVQAEALFDPGRIEGLSTDPWMSAWNAHARRGIHGNLETPAFGGGTIRAEFEALTGYDLEAFPAVQYPYYGLLVDDLPTLPNHLATLGYRTRVVHPFKGSFWNRQVAMRALGFESLSFEEDFPDAPRAGPYISDAALYRRILEEAQRPQARARPDLFFLITMENHGPWMGEFRDELDDTLPDLPASLSGLPRKTRIELRRYLWHVRSGDRAFGSLVDRLLARDEPTIVVAYGDHLPALRTVYTRVRFDDGKSVRAQPVPFMIVSNTGIASRGLEHALPMSSLPSLVLEAAGLPQPGHFGFESVLRRLPAGHPDLARADDLRRHTAWRDFSSAGDNAGTREDPAPGG